MLVENDSLSKIDLEKAREIGSVSDEVTLWRSDFVGWDADSKFWGLAELVFGGFWCIFVVICLESGIFTAQKSLLSGKLHRNLPLHPHPNHCIS